jgi:hypothetical protein
MSEPLTDDPTQEPIDDDEGANEDQEGDPNTAAPDHGSDGGAV